MLFICRFATGVINEMVFVSQMGNPFAGGANGFVNALVEDDIYLQVRS